MHWTFDRLKPKVWAGEDWAFAQLKRDGFRLTLFHDAMGQRYAYGRETREDLEFLSRFPALSKLIEKTLARVPRTTAIDGEVYVPGRPASDVPTALRGGLPMVFEAFALPMWDGNDCTFSKVSDADWKLKQMGFDTVPLYETSRLKGFDANAMIDFAKQEGGEGLVLKQCNYAEWYKIKGEDTLDAFVIGWKEGKGKYFGEMGSLEVAMWTEDADPDADWAKRRYREDMLGTWGRYAVDNTRVIANVSGMSEDQRFEMTPTNVMGRVCEVKYQYVGSGGKLRHPRFMRWRDDKPRNECFA